MSQTVKVRRDPMVGGFSARWVAEYPDFRPVAHELTAFGYSVVYGTQAPDGRWVNVSVVDPDRFGFDRSTVKGFQAWVDAFLSAADGGS